MSRRHYYAAAAACLMALAALGLPGPAAAQLLGDRRTEATDCASAVGGNVTNSTVSVVCGISPEQFSEYMRLAVSNRPGDYTELLHRLDELIPASSRVRVQAIARFFAIVGEAAVPPEQPEAKLIEIAQRYQALLVQLEGMSSPDLEVQRLKAQAQEALDAGDFNRSEEFLNQAKARDLLIIEQMRATMERMRAALDARQLSAAEAAGANGDLMMTQIRYAEAARYYAEAVGLTPEKYAEQLSERLTDWATAAWRAGDYPTAVEAAHRTLVLDEARLPAGDAQLGSRLNNLALFYQATGRWAEAEPLHRRALTVFEKALGPDHPDVAIAANNLAVLYHDTGRHAEAEPLFLRALAILEESLPPDHPLQALYRENYAGLLDELGRRGEAAELQTRAKAIRQQRELPPRPP
jgi:tetratricopeptide (TPR) repeat protein